MNFNRRINDLNCSLPQFKRFNFDLSYGTIFNKVTVTPCIRCTNTTSSSMYACSNTQRSTLTPVTPHLLRAVSGAIVLVVLKSN